MTARARPVRGLVAAVVAGALVVVGAPAVAWWSASGSVTVAASAATVPPPTSLTCTTTGTTLLRSATVRWTAPSPAPARYRVTIGGGGESTSTETTATQLEITQSLLGGLLDSILELLLGGTTLQVSVQAVHASGWTSVPTTTVPIRGALVSGQGAAGVACG